MTLIPQSDGVSEVLITTNDQIQILSSTSKLTLAVDDVPVLIKELQVKYEELKNKLDA